MPVNIFKWDELFFYNNRPKKTNMNLKKTLNCLEVLLWIRWSFFSWNADIFFVYVQKIVVILKQFSLFFGVFSQTFLFFFFITLLSIFAHKRHCFRLPTHTQTHCWWCHKNFAPAPLLSPLSRSFFLLLAIYIKKRVVLHKQTTKAQKTAQEKRNNTSCWSKTTQKHRVWIKV